MFRVLVFLQIRSSYHGGERDKHEASVANHTIGSVKDLVWFCVCVIVRLLESIIYSKIHKNGIYSMDFVFGILLYLLCAFTFTVMPPEFQCGGGMCEGNNTYVQRLMFLRDQFFVFSCTDGINNVF